MVRKGTVHMDLNRAAQKLLIGVERATVTDKYDRKISNPETSMKYSEGFSKFVGHPVPEATGAYVDSVPAMTEAWNRRPTNAEKWKQAMETIQ